MTIRVRNIKIKYIIKVPSIDKEAIQLDEDKNNTFQENYNLEIKIIFPTFSLKEDGKAPPGYSK